MQKTEKHFTKGKLKIMLTMWKCVSPQTTKPRNICSRLQILNVHLQVLEVSTP